MIKIHQMDNLEFLKFCSNACTNLIYIDPPFNTGKKQIGTRQQSNTSYEDSFDDYIEFLRPRLVEAKRILKSNGSLLFHCDWRESHYCKILLDQIFGRSHFMNELIWAYDYGAKQKDKWPTKHDTIFWYVNNPKDYIFNYEKMWRLEYMAPSLAGKEKVARGKITTDVIWNTICPTNGPERTGYPTQKPLSLLKKFVEVHSNPGDKCMDFFAGSGTFGMACEELSRDCVLVDSNPQAIEVMRQRFQYCLKVEQNEQEV